jgi:hypothetical protein
MGSRTQRDESFADTVMPPGKKKRLASTDMRMAMGPRGGGPSMVAEGQSESAENTRAATRAKIPKFFAWLESLSDEHEYASAKMFLPASRDWTDLSTDQMIDRR